MLDEASKAAAALGDEQKKQFQRILDEVEDTAEELALVGRKLEQFSDKHEGYVGTFAAQRRKLEANVNVYMSTGLELFDEFGDINFLPNLWASAPLLFWLSIAALLLNILGRAWAVYRDGPTGL
jgi:hypothetical protein